MSTPLELALMLIRANADALEERGFKAWANENRKMARKIETMAEKVA
jgi:hypothetical protein